MEKGEEVMGPYPEEQWITGKWAKCTAGELIEKLQQVPPTTRVILHEGDLMYFLWRGPRCFVVLSTDGRGVKE